MENYTKDIIGLKNKILSNQGISQAIRPADLEEFKKLYKALAEKMLPMVYKLKFLK